MQAALFDTARLVPIAPAQAFKALYRVLLDRDSGPKAGNLLAFLDQNFVVQRFQELTSNESLFWYETSISKKEFGAWLTENQNHINRLPPKTKLLLPSDVFSTPDSEDSGWAIHIKAGSSTGVVEFTVELDDNRKHMKRVWLEQFADQAAFMPLLRRMAHW